jgi:hypothetical protein
MKETLSSHLFDYLSLINMAQDNQNVLREETVIRKLNYFFKLNEMLAMGVGRNYAVMLRELYETMNKIYLFYSA